MSKLKELIKKPETKRWIADKAGGAIVAQVVVLVVIGIADHLADGELEIVDAVISLFTE